MKKKWILVLLCAVIVLQLSALAGFIMYYNNLDSKIETQGTEYRFRVLLESIEPDGTIHFSTGNGYDDLFTYDYYYSGDSNSTKAVRLKVDADGFASFGSRLDSVPKDGDYLLLNRPNAFPNTTEYASGNTALYNPTNFNLLSYYHNKTSRIDSDVSFEQPEAYVTVRIYQGHAAITGMYIAGEDVRTRDALPEPVRIEGAGENA